MKRERLRSIVIDRACRHEKLGRERESALAEARDAGDPAAVQELILHNARFAVWVAVRNRYAREYFDLDERIEIAMEGLCKAAWLHDPRKSRFTTFAAMVINQRFSRYIESEKRARRGTGPIHHRRDGGDPLECLVARERGPHARAVITAAWGCLTPAQRRIVEARYGMDGMPAATCSEVAGRFGTTRQNVSQLERQAIDRLARRLKGTQVDPDWEPGAGTTREAAR
jgi:RNA polymerase sporulation-specific sigma factor